MHRFMARLSCLSFLTVTQLVCGQTVIDMPPPPSVRPVAAPVDAELVAAPQNLVEMMPTAAAVSPVPAQPPAQALDPGRVALRRYALARYGTRDTYFVGDRNRYATYGTYSHLNFGGPWCAPTWGVWHGRPFFVGNVGFLGSKQCKVTKK